MVNGNSTKNKPDKSKFARRVVHRTYAPKTNAKITSSTDITK